jgi:acyl-CoA oxidase
MERLLIVRLAEKVSDNQDLSLKPALDRILYLAALHLLDKHLVYFYQGGYFSSSEQPAVLVRETILSLCKEMKRDAVGLVDAMAPPDYVINSALGESNGLVYKNLYNSMVQNSGAFERIEFLEDYLVKTKFASLKSKI